jgi:hypothetical protein
MMPKNIIATLAAGLLSAALLLAVAIGQPGALIFAYLAPLPIYCLGLAMGYRLAAVAVVGGSVAIALTTTVLVGLGYLAVIGAPAVILLQRALLARAGDKATGAIEWYPAGQLTVWWAGIAAAWMIAAVIYAASDGIEMVIREFLLNFFEVAIQALSSAPIQLEPAEFVDVIAPTFLAMIAISGALMHAINATLAQGVLVRFGRNLRPSPALSDVVLPRQLAPVLVVVVIMAWLLDGTLGYLAQNLVVIGVLPYIIGGLSIVHLAAAQTTARLTWLIGFYLFFLMAVNYLSIVLVIIGVADQWIDLKKHVLRLKSQRLGAANSTRKDERNRDNDVANDDDQDR